MNERASFIASRFCSRPIHIYIYINVVYLEYNAPLVCDCGIVCVHVGLLMSMDAAELCARRGYNLSVCVDEPEYCWASLELD